MQLNPLLTGLGPNPMAALHERVREMATEGPLLDFSIGDPDEPTVPAARRALLDTVGESSSYPVAAGTADTRRAVAEYVARRFGRDVDPDRNVVITAGSKEAVFHLPFVVGTQGAGAVLYPTPGYGIYDRGALLAGLEARPHVLDGDFVVRPDTIPEDHWDGATLVWVNAPHNPAGTLVSRDDLATIMDRAAAAGAWVGADECYVDIHEPDIERPVSVLELADDDLTGVVSVLSCSKRDGMTGYRVGALVGDAELINTTRILKQSAGTVPPDFVQAAAAAAWRTDDHVDERNRIFSAKRSHLRAAFEHLGHEVIGSEAGLYLWVRVGDDLAVADRLLASRVVVSPGRAFGPGGEGHIRLALVPDEAACERAAEEIVTCLTAS